ncbi:peptidoglycan DD-metalloendopeptidase family protein [Kitasatospora sp. NPDC050543]|uniref:peptidoglycan DD-metalloendopeptidase family protein n=1 Tax=Kitasatospora sp. NPDC050543 TaxID=3364054 RepID=UPI0037A5F8B1
MPAQATPLRNRLPRLARIGIATGVVGAVFGLPLVTAATAQAHEAPAAKTQQSAPAAATSTDAVAVAEKPAAAPAEAAPAPAAAPAEQKYKVVGGDSLSKIAASHKVEGGWHALYDHNRDVVGANPNLIFPGQQLSLNGKPVAQAPAAPVEKPAAPVQKPAAPAKKPAAPAPVKQTPKPAKPTEKPAAPAKQAPKPAATTPATPAPATKPATANASGYTAPIAGAKLGTAYGVAGSMWASGHHTGADFVAPTGTPLKAVAAGTVVKAGPGGAYGNEVEIKLADGKYAQYAHLSSIGVKVGQTVTVGQQIGLSGATGNVTGPHLHFEIRTGSEYGSDIDPIAYLRAHGVSI